MRNSIERAFASQVHQYHHDYKEKRNVGMNRNATWDANANEGDLELPMINNSSSKGGEKYQTEQPTPVNEPIQLPAQTR